ncbi:GGDEF domain-containing protein [Acidovorax sp. SUPP3334]|uniref:GGDEF domain-containing protein n=1 Tax=Acidovorax sp. SUPP3334 TaxID=2920881 RepID=UPI0023DE603E|nr:GGDEF domain-containing protein [Acidovorax sp. SUPP3334]GKT20438.1 GGDEF domain-containing protein [Acidovorax sp. SUPP3334]
MGFTDVWATWHARRRMRFENTDAFPLSEELNELDVSTYSHPSEMGVALVLKQHLNRPRTRVVPVLLCLLYLACALAFYALGVVDFSTVLVVAGLIAVLVVSFTGLFYAGLHERFADRQMRLPIVVGASSALLLVFYLEPVTQIALTPFLFVVMAYGLFTLSRNMALAVCVGILAGYGLVAALHYGQGENAALLRLAALHMVSLALALPAYVLLMGRVRTLHRLLQKKSSEMRSITESSRQDALAGCLNRRAILAALEEQKQLADESGIPLCMAVVDLDHFKRINDEMGHLEGDEVLRTFSKLGQTAVRADDFFGRYGGEEFLVIFPATPLLPALNTCERIRVQVESHGWDNPWLKGKVTVSIGVTQYVLGETALEFFARADAAMYLAKQGGRNQVVVQEPVVPGAAANDDEAQGPAHGYF